MKIFVLVTAVTIVHCYSNGAPEVTCDNMCPTHGEAQQTPSPYVMEMDGDNVTYSTGKTICGNYSFATSVIQWRCFIE